MQQPTLPYAGNGFQSMSAHAHASSVSVLAPDFSDNEPGAIKKLQDSNEFYRHHRWPDPYCRTDHRLHCGDARNLDWIPDNSVHLVVTSPPYWNLKEYPRHQNQLGSIDNYERFLRELDKVWSECARVLVPGGRVCCVVGDVCLPRKVAGRHYVMPLHADILTRTRGIGLDSLTPILWFKIANGATEVDGNGSGFYGKPYQPGAVVKNDFEYILFLRKGSAYRSPSNVQKALSMLSNYEMKEWLRTAWTDIKGESTRKGHPAPFPLALAERLVRLFSFAGDTVLDPFLGTGTTSIAAMLTGRNSIGNEVDENYVAYAREKFEKSASVRANAALFDVSLKPMRSRK